LIEFSAAPVNDRRLAALRHHRLAKWKELTLDHVTDRATYLRLAETLSAFLGRLRSSAQTMDTLDRQKIVRLLVKDVFVSDDSIVIRHSISVSPEPPAGGNLPPSGRSNPNGGGSYLLRSGRDWSALVKC
jgi:site-specific DNA recombinase